MTTWWSKKRILEAEWMKGGRVPVEVDCHQEDIVSRGEEGMENMVGRRGERYDIIMLGEPLWRSLGHTLEGVGLVVAWTRWSPSVSCFFPLRSTRFA